MSRMSIDDRLSKTKFNSDDDFSHIIIDKASCDSCADKPCTYSCPAARYRTDENGKLLFDHVGCLECGNCRLVCERLHKDKEGYHWDYPLHAKGVVYKCG